MESIAGVPFIKVCAKGLKIDNLTYWRSVLRIDRGRPLERHVCLFHENPPVVVSIHVQDQTLQSDAPGPRCISCRGLVKWRHPQFVEEAW